MVSENHSPLAALLKVYLTFYKELWVEGVSWKRQRKEGSAKRERDCSTAIDFSDSVSRLSVSMAEVHKRILLQTTDRQLRRSCLILSLNTVQSRGVARHKGLLGHRPPITQTTQFFFLNVCCMCEICYTMYYTNLPYLAPYYCHCHIDTAESTGKGDFVFLMY